MENQLYAFRQTSLLSLPMPSQSTERKETFGARLAALRKAAGYTQTELAAELNTSQRMIAYYEGQTEHPPAAWLGQLARLLGVSVEELLGVAPIKRIKKQDSRLQRRLQQLEKLPTTEKRQVMTLLDAFIERAQLKEKTEA